jgi:hypothetical protein
MPLARPWRPAVDGRRSVLAGLRKDRDVRKDKDELVLAVEEGRHPQAEAAWIAIVAGGIEVVVVAWSRRSVTAGRVSARTRPGRSRRCSINP